MRTVIDEHEVELVTVRPESEPTFDDAAATGSIDSSTSTA